MADAGAHNPPRRLGIECPPSTCQQASQTGAVHCLRRCSSDDRLPLGDVSPVGIVGDVENALEAVDQRRPWGVFPTSAGTPARQKAERAPCSSAVAAKPLIAPSAWSRYSSMSRPPATSWLNLHASGPVAVVSTLAVANQVAFQARKPALGIPAEPLVPGGQDARQ